MGAMVLVQAIIDESGFVLEGFTAIGKRYGTTNDMADGADVAWIWVRRKCMSRRRNHGYVGHRRLESGLQRDMADAHRQAIPLFECRLRRPTKSSPRSYRDYLLKKTCVWLSRPDRTKSPKCSPSGQVGLSGAESLPSGNCARKLSGTLPQLFPSFGLSFLMSLQDNQ